MKVKEMMKKLMMIAAAMGLAALPAMAETICSGESAEVKLDLATGTVRTPAATETLTYSTEWDGGDAVTLAVNGTTLASGLTGSGTYDWTPSGTGLFTLTHTASTGSGDVVLAASFGVPAAEVTKGGVTTQHATLPAAFEAIGENGTGTVKLLADIDLGLNGVAYVPNGSDFTLDLNGKKIFQTEDEDLAPITYAGGTNGKLTIDDTVGGGGITVNRANSAAAETNLNLHAVCCGGANGTLTVNGGTFAVTNNMGSAVIFYKEGNGTWSFNGGTYLAGSEGACSAQFLFCWGSSGKTYVTGGTYSIEAKDDAGIGIYVANDGTEQIEITGGDFDISMKKDWSPAFEFCNTCVIKGGTFDITSLATGAIGFNVKAGALLVVSNGTFSVSAAKNAANCLNATYGSQVEIAGGTFNAVSGTSYGFGYVSCAAIAGNQGSRIVITGTPVINQPTGDANDKFMVSVNGAWLDFTGYMPEFLGSIYVSNDGNTGFVKGDMSKCWWLSTSGGHFSTRPVEGKYWCANDMRPVVSSEAETKAEYPWMIGAAVAELVPGSGTNYTCVADALTAAGNGETVALLVDVAENISITLDKENTLDLAGHVLKGDDTGTAPVVKIDSADAAITIRDSSAGHTGAITTGGAEFAGNGAGINIAAGSLSFYDVTITNCVASGNGGAIYQAQYANLLMSGCTVKNNTAALSGGGIYKQGGCTGDGDLVEDYGKCVLLDTEVVGNTAGTSGGGVYFQKMMNKYSCFVAGTRIAMADGTTKAIEDVVEGDVVKTFDHEGGTNSSARVYLAYKGETKAVPFTLWFDAGEEVKDEQRNGSTLYPLPSTLYPLPSTLSIVDRHDLLLKDTRMYVTITASNVGQYLGAKFYGEDGAWHTLTNATMGTEAVEYYSIYSAQHQNVYANGLLTVADDVDYLLNIYELDEGLKADATELAADVAEYGYFTYERAATYGVDSEEWYVESGIKYLNVAMGKGLISLAYCESLFASVDGGRGATALPATAATTGRALSPLSAAMTPKLAQAAAPKLAAANGEPTLDDYAAGWLILGAGVVVTNNTVNGAKGNIYLATANSGADSLIDLTATHDGVCAGVACEWGSGMFTMNVNVAASDVALFTSDNAAYVVKFVPDHLELVSVVTFTPTTIDHTTTAVYTNGVPMEVAESYQIESNATATVVYTAADGYAFSDGTTAKTNVIDTSVNPATAEAPAAPTKQLRYVAPVYVDNIASNGIAYWTTNAVPNGYTVVESVAERVTWGATGATSWYVVTNGTFQIDGGVECVGDVNLVLCDGAKLTVTNVADYMAGIQTDASGSFTIYGTPDGAGELSVTSGYGGAGIGGSNADDKYEGSHITINGGVVTAVGAASGYDSGGAGIGGGSYGNGSDIVINGGVVCAKSILSGAGIGGGYHNSGSDIVINGGTVWVSNDGSCELIGSGNGGSAAIGVTITAESNVMFDLVGADGVRALPEFEGCWILTPETLTEDRVLVSGIDESGAAGVCALPWGLLNAATGATGEIVVNGEGVAFANKLLSLPHTDNKLMLAAVDYSSIVPKPVANTTYTIYTNGTPVDAAAVVVERNEPDCFVTYEVTASGYTFTNGLTTITYACDTSVDPAVVGAPDALVTEIKDVTVVEKENTQVEETEKPASVEDQEVWDAATNMVASTVVLDGTGLVNITNVVDAAKKSMEDVEKVTAEVRVVITPEDAQSSVGNRIAQMMIDVTPKLITTIENGETTSVSTNEIEKGEAPILITLDVSGFERQPMLIEHTHKIGGSETRVDRYYPGDEATTDTFLCIWTDEIRTVSFLMQEFSDVVIYSRIQVGDDAWAVIHDDGRCEITGTGALWSSDSAKTSVLSSYRQYLTGAVTVESGITEIGKNFFAGLSGVRSVTVEGDTLATIGEKAFLKCFSLTNVTCAAASVQTLGAHAFAACNSLERIAFASAPTSVGDQAIVVKLGIRMNGGEPEIYTMPDLSIGDGTTLYSLYGAETLEGPWEKITNRENYGNYRFFKISDKAE